MQLQIIVDAEEDTDWVNDGEVPIENNQEEDQLENNQITLSLDSIEEVTGIISIRLVGKVNRKEVGFWIDT